MFADIIQAWIAAGEPLSVVERKIEQLSDDEDLRAAMWLFAWSIEQRRDRAPVALQLEVSG